MTPNKLILPIFEIVFFGMINTVNSIEINKIVQDSLVFSGTLKNGMSYSIMRNAIPKSTASIRLYLRVGSLDENDEEQGYAHFVEHMAFNGSKNVPEGELVKILQRHGLAFGFDANSSTYFDKTIYMLELPHINGEILDTALMLLSETAKI